MEEINCSFEEALARLEQVIAELEQGELPLAAAIMKYEEGNRLIQFCNAQLQHYKQKISILQEEGGQIKLEEAAFEEE